MRSGSRLARTPLVIAAIALMVFLGVAERVTVGRTIALDAWLRDMLHAHASQPLTAVMRFLSLFGEPFVLTTLGFGVVVAFLGVGWRRRAAIWAVVMVGAGVLDPVLKAAFHRARPEPFFNTPLPGSYGFPSGHALFSACFFGAIAALCTESIGSLPGRVALWAGAILVAFAIGLSRIYLGVHYPGDVLGGFALGAFWVALVVSVSRATARTRQ